MTAPDGLVTTTATIAFLSGPPPAGGWRLTAQRRHEQAPDAMGSGFAAGGMTMGESAPEGATSAWKVDVQFHLDRLPGLEGLLRVLLLRRNPTLSRDQFARHWREVHAPIVLAHQPLFHRYASAVSTAADAPWDGVVLQWFADLATFDRHERLIWAEKRAVAEDLPRFVHDLANTPQFLAART